MLKTWLLLVHPRAKFQPSSPRPRPWAPVPAEVYAWLVNGQPPPRSLSAWAFRHVQGKGDGRPVATPRLFLPKVIADGVSMPFEVLDLTLSLVNVVVVFHPGWPIRHLPAVAGDVMQLWGAPQPGTREPSAAEYWPGRNCSVGPLTSVNGRCCSLGRCGTAAPGASGPPPQAATIACLVCLKLSTPELTAPVTTRANSLTKTLNA
jgi:hypothetical protein